MRVIVAGGGDVGRQVAHQLAGSGHQVTVIEADAARAASLAADGRLAVVTGDAGHLDVLERAGGLGADVLVAATARDEDNLVISMLAKRHLGLPRVVARVNDADARWLFDERSGVDAAISSAMALVLLIEEATRPVADQQLRELFGGPG